jgi:hypothetical protein
MIGVAAPNLILLLLLHGSRGLASGATDREPRVRNDDNRLLPVKLNVELRRRPALADTLCVGTRT